MKGYIKLLSKSKIEEQKSWKFSKNVMSGGGNNVQNKIMFMAEKQCVFLFCFAQYVFHVN